ncbi:hypothetical protein GCM10008025_19440 [Ornithinibacillus halotolerans]|uniref:Uncharacterized protein n=1 Tax=Ornithinibacillus halotolerans TaxID=1274357 RepID=A0A916W8N1_9BACI|nr:hypothetical protein GCM10008025_19440 [Ornithinibacillus halotolerans]
MSWKYSDYLNKTVLSIPDKFINVKTRESQYIIQRVHEQLAYHSQNNTLIYLILSALDDYLQPQTSRDAGAEKILTELVEIKKLILNRSTTNHSIINTNSISKPPRQSNLRLQDIEELIEAFGG